VSRSDEERRYQRSQTARSKDGAKHNSDNLSVRNTATCSTTLSPFDRQTVTFSGQRIEKLTKPTPVQLRVFELLGALVPLTLQ
jgi:hypothetical protein